MPDLLPSSQGYTGKVRWATGKTRPGGRARLLRLDSSPQAFGGQDLHVALDQPAPHVPVGATRCGREP